MGGTSGLGVTYLVKKGDTLWDIAEAELGSPWEWPRLYAFNNRDEVVRSGVRRITDPDLIYAGETIRIPRLGAAPPRTKSLSSARSTDDPVKPKDVPREPESLRRADPPTEQRPPELRKLLPEVLIPFSIAYDLKDLPEATLFGPGYVARIKLSGMLIIQLAKRVPLSYVTNKGWEMNLKSQTDHALGSLISDTKIGYNPATRKISFENRMVSQSNVTGIPQTALAIAVASNRPVPVLRAEMIYLPIRGSIHGNTFSATDFKVVIELELEAQRPGMQRGPSTGLLVVVAGSALLAGILVAEYFSLGTATPIAVTAMPVALAMIGIGLHGEVPNAPMIRGGSPVRIK